MSKSNEDSEITFRKSAEATSEVDLKRQVEIDYCSYFAYHEARKELEAKQPKLARWRPLRRRVKGRRVF
jgi:hypothetical protein